MGKKGGGSAPAVPDPVATANAQAAANKDAIVTSSTLNAIDQYGPSGSSTFARRPDGTPYANTINLNPTQQDIFDTQQQVTKNLSGDAYNAISYLPTDSFNYSGLPYDPVSYGNTGQYDSNVASANYQRQMAFLQPAWDQQEAKQHNDLVQQGFQPGNDAYDKATASQQRTEDQSRLAAAEGAQAAGSQAGATQMQQEQTLRGTAAQERLTQRQEPINEAAGYIQGSPIFNNPSPQGTTPVNMQAPDYMGAVYNSYNAASNAYNQAQQQRSNMWGAVGSAAASLGAAAFSSDEDQKTGIKTVKGMPFGIDPARSSSTPVLDGLKKLPVKEWQYRGDSPANDGGQRHVGPMAQDMQGVFGIGNGRSIPAGVPTAGGYPDAFGLTLAAVKELDRKIENRRRA